MTEPAPDTRAQNRWHRLWHKPCVWFIVGIPIGGVMMFFLGIVFWSSFDTFLEYSNTLNFCLSCHEMRDYMYVEYKESPHYKNASGVRAICSDCHVPRKWTDKMGVKIRATINELPKKFLGTISTKEKFEAKRLDLAKEVWRRMKESDSETCRSCHALEAMDLEQQDRSAKKKHTLEYVKTRGKTCIDCHKGIAHHLPKGYEEEDL